jgi:hypothetical protein
VIRHLTKIICSTAEHVHHSRLCNCVGDNGLRLVVGSKIANDAIDAHLVGFKALCGLLPFAALRHLVGLILPDIDGPFGTVLEIVVRLLESKCFPFFLGELFEKTRLVIRLVLAGKKRTLALQPRTKHLSFYTVVAISKSYTQIESVLNEKQSFNHFLDY